MKTLPPIPPNNPRFETIGPLLFWIAPHPDSKKPGKIAINLEDDPNLEDWRSLIAADAEVSFRKEAEHEDRQGDHIASYKARQNARDWRSWAEPEEEADNEK
jgi:hypothetical protein